MSHDLANLQGQPVIIGSGAAGLMTALLLAPEPVVLLTKAGLGRESSSELAQGGMAASLAADDSPELHLADTLAAGAGLCDADAVRRIVEAAPQAIHALARLGVAFDLDGDGQPKLGLEAAHSRHRIVHAAGDATGRVLVRALVAVVRKTPSITVIEGMEARRLLVEDGAIAGVLAAGETGAATLATNRVVLATGGIGGLFEHSTNPLACFGQGLALAARAGAVLADLEFVQFHPTALDCATRPMPLVSEAVRGEGAILIDETGRRFMADIAGAELAPRDVVARAVWSELVAGRRVFLDARACLGSGFAARFPAITGLCNAAGIDPAIEPIPVRSAVHYHMGGVAVDGEGRSSVPGLWACGEVASTGLHGANRLASNSLVEAVVAADWVARSVAAAPAQPVRKPRPAIMPMQANPASLRGLVTCSLGIVRDGEALRDAVARLLPLTLGSDAVADPALVALMMAVAAHQREESRGSHYRSDFPASGAQPRSSRLTMRQALDAAVDLVATDMPFARRA